MKHRQLAAMPLALTILAIAGCSGEPTPPPVSMEHIEEAQKKQVEVHRKEYGSEATKSLK
jgi:hypothetical protein